MTVGCAATGLLAVVVGSWSGGCAHSTSAKDGDTTAADKRGDKAGDKDGDKTKRERRAESAHDGGAIRERSSAREGAPVLATSPAGLLKPTAVGDIQDALASRGLLDSADKSGTLDAKTKAALRELQRRHGLPATGMPDDATVRTLNLDPGKVFVVSDEHQK